LIPVANTSTRDLLVTTSRGGEEHMQSLCMM